MSRNYDNWEKLVGAVLKREAYRQLALSHSVSSSSINDESSCFSFNLTTLFDHRSHDNAPDDSSICRRSLLGVVFIPVEARNFSIRNEHFPDHAYSFGFHHTDAAKVKPFLSIDIGGKINTRLLTSNTIYGAYLLFVEGRDFAAKAMITFVNEETDVDAERQLVNGGREVVLGSFYVAEREEREVEARLVESSYCKKAGIIVEGIKFRPLVNVKQLDLIPSTN